MDLILGISPLIAAGIVFRIICNKAKADANSNKYLVVLILAIEGAEYFYLSEHLGSEPPVVGWGLAAAIVYNIFKIRQDPEAAEAMKPKLYMQDGRMVLLIPGVKAGSGSSPAGHGRHELYDLEYTFHEVSVTRNYGIISIAGSGIKTTLEHSDAADPGIPVNREYFQDQTFKYNIEEVRIYDVDIEGQNTQQCPKPAQ